MMDVSSYDRKPQNFPSSFITVPARETGVLTNKRNQQATLEILKTT